MDRHGRSDLRERLARKVANEYVGECRIESRSFESISELSDGLR